MAEDVRHGPAVRPGLVRTTSVVLVVAAAAATAVLFVREHRANARQVEQIRRDLDRGPVVRVARVKLADARKKATAGSTYASSRLCKISAPSSPLWRRRLRYRS